VKDARLHHYRENQLVLGPETIHFDITNSCNTNCITCWDHSPLLTLGRSAAWKRMRIDPASFAATLSDIESLGGLRAVILSGMGDPMTHPEAYAFIEEVKKRDLHLTIITNLIPADPVRIVELDVDELLIGIHGASEAAYLDFHPSFRSEEWRKLHAMLAYFQASGRRYKHVHVIANVNAHELTLMCEQAAHYGAKQVNFKLASLQYGTEAAAITEVQRTALLDYAVPAAAARAHELGLATNLAVFQSQLLASCQSENSRATANMADVGCYMGHYYARIQVDGTVLYCCNTDIQVGSLQRSSFSDLWRSEAWQSVRQRLRNGDYYASCAQCGKVNQNVKLAKRLRQLPFFTEGPSGTEPAARCT
jgi:MoaA/NifB/PqqE/SkfB family radical SAM enzyme